MKYFDPVVWLKGLQQECRLCQITDYPEVIIEEIVATKQDKAKIITLLKEKYPIAYGCMLRELSALDEIEVY